MVLLALLSVSFSLGFPGGVRASTFMVNTTDDGDDGTCDGTHCSLREAINAANLNAGADSITFDIPAGLDPGCDATSGVCTIQPGTELPALTDNDTTIDGFTQPGANPPTALAPAALRIVLDGNVATPASAVGLRIQGSGGHLIKGLTIHRFEYGIYLSGSLVENVQVEGCHIGTDYLGISAMPNNEDGIRITMSASNNVIGGSSPSARNVISGNSSDGIELELASTGNVISGNFIGVDASGMLPLGNSGTGLYVRDSSSSNVIGGSIIGAGNVISANGVDGIALSNALTRENVVSGNLIGLGVDGTTDLGNGQNGIQIVNGADTNTIGGALPAERNLIACNDANGIQIWTQFTEENEIIGNYIGVDITGEAACGNSNSGIRIAMGAASNVIGGDTTGEGNVISGSNYGLYIDGAFNTVSGNHIGTNAAGTSAIANGTGIYIYNGVDNTIGGSTQAERNVISGNSDYGVTLAAASCSGNEVIGNYIGLDVTGSAALGNGTAGVEIRFGANNNIIGTGIPGEGNVISGNQNGISIRQADTDLNVVSGNFIGTDATGLSSIPNIYGIKIEQGAQFNTIGGDTTGEGNLISGNTANGIQILGQGTDANVICGNMIGLDLTGASALANNTIGVELYQGPDLTVVGGSSPGCQNVISGNQGDGVRITGNSTSGNVVSGNLIGLNQGGTAAVGNGQNGVSIAAGAASNEVGGDTIAERNVISGNTLNGVHVSGSGSDANRLIGNYIGTDAAGTSSVANLESGVRVSGGAENTEIGGSIAAEANLISGNQEFGVSIEGLYTYGSIVSGNLIGVNANGSGAIPNTYTGVIVFGGAKDTIIGGDLPGERNVISGNLLRGVTLYGIGTNNNTVYGNYIGTDMGGVLPLGNSSHGVLVVDGADGNTIGPDNLIAYNNEDGVSIESARTATITQNSIHSNTGGGITLVGGGNDMLPPPTIVGTSPGSVFIEGSAAPAGGLIEIFSNPDADGEGKSFLGSTTADVSGIWFITVPCFSDTYLTATVTDLEGNTSEFSVVFESTVSCTFLPLIMR